MEHTRFNHVVVVGKANGIVESDVITATIPEWEESPESKTKDWSISVDTEAGTVTANRLVGVPVNLPTAAAPSVNLYCDNCGRVGSLVSGCFVWMAQYSCENGHPFLGYFLALGRRLLEIPGD